MSRFPARKSQIDFGRILRNLVLVVVAIVCLLSVTLYFNFEHATTSIVCTFIKGGLDQVSASVDFMTESTRNLIFQLHQGDTVVNRLLYYSNPAGESYYDVNILQSLMQLRNYCTTGSSVHSIYLYNGSAGRIYSSLYEKGEAATDAADFFDKDFVDMAGRIGQYQPLAPIPRRIGTASGQTVDVYTYLLYDGLEAGGRSYNIVAVNLYEARMHNIIKSLSSSQKDDVLIVDGGGRAMIASHDSALLEDISGRSYIRRILDASAPSGYFVDDVGGASSLITFVSSPSLGWRFLRVTPYTAVTGQLNRIKYTSILIILLVLAAGVLSSFYISRQLYKPIDGLMTELTALKREKSSSIFSQKQQMLKELLLDDATAFDGALKSRFAEFNVRLDPDGRFLLLIFQIDHYRDFCNAYNLNDRGLVKFSLMNMVSERAAKWGPNEAVDLGRDRVVLILNGPDGGLPRPAMQEFIAGIQREAQSYVRVSLSVFVSGSSGHCDSICGLYNATSRIASYRLAYGHGCVVFLHDDAAKADGAAVYSLEKEKMMTNALMLGKIGRAKEILNSMIVHHKKNPDGQIKASLLRVTLAIHAALEMIEKSNGLMLNYSLDGMISDQEAIETMDEFKSYFFAVFDAVQGKLEDRKGNRHSALIANVIEIIRNGYMDKNLSLEQVADRVGISPSYLRRLFKHMTGKSLAEYVVDFRMERAKELLLTTGHPINEIADLAGFINSSYFYTLFKKLNSITPNDFRLNGQSERNQRDNRPGRI